jgi:hypothetical protein
MADCFNKVLYMNGAQYSAINQCLNNICSKTYEQPFVGCLSLKLKISTTISFSKQILNKSIPINHCFKLSSLTPLQTLTTSIKTTTSQTTTLLSNTIQTTSALSTQVFSPNQCYSFLNFTLNPLSNCNQINDYCSYNQQVYIIN